MDEKSQVPEKPFKLYIRRFTKHWFDHKGRMQGRVEVYTWPGTVRDIYEGPPMTRPGSIANWIIRKCNEIEAEYPDHDVYISNKITNYDP